MLGSICRNTFTLVRQSILASETDLTPTVANPSFNISTSPKISTSLSFKFDQRVSGTVVITGELNTNSQSETITITNNRIGKSMKKFDVISTIEFGGDILTTEPTVKVKYINLTGSQTPTESEIISGFPISLSRKTAKMDIGEGGSQQIETTLALIPYTEQFTPQEFDILTIIETNQQFQIIGSPMFNQVGISTHWNCNIKKYSKP